MKITSSLSLRPLAASDAPALFALTDRNRAYLRQWLPWLDHTRTESDSSVFIGSASESALADTRFTFGLFRDEILIGVVSFNEIDRASRTGLIGYWLGQEHAGHGLMTQAVRALIDHGFKALALERVVIRVATANHRSQAIPERLGFTREGVQPQAEWLYDRYVDLTVNSLSKQEWLNKNARPQ